MYGCWGCFGFGDIVVNMSCGDCLRCHGPKSRHNDRWTGCRLRVRSADAGARSGSGCMPRFATLRSQWGDRQKLIAAAQLLGGRARLCGAQVQKMRVNIGYTA
ncbi:unnamed protein product [Symbiodinium natans]|uniref:Uncharacterized protein n=1 Tax=Symbiodinium natans TaxID=878477 RepID=A0A812K6U1_9DINO|nr:unnamed protein product [Symbiodinium natans]